MPAEPTRPTLEEFAARPLLPGDAYTTPEGYLVFTAQYHLRRGYCCRNGCRHCPWNFRALGPPPAGK
ncbi:MAG: DUF5522 domain-containing protein [Janthinobacterium lividum]